MANGREQVVIDVQLNSQQAAKRAEELSLALFKQREELKKVNKQLRDNEKAYAAGEKSEEEYRKEAAKLTAQQNTLKQSISNTSKELRTANKEANVVSGSLNEQRAVLSRLLKEYDNTPRATARAKELEAAIKEQTKVVKGAEEETERYQRNVGNYSNAVQEALQSTAAYNGVLGDTLGAIQVLSGQVAGIGSAINTLSANFTRATGASGAFATGLRAVSLAIAATGIGVLVVALGTLVAFFSRTERGARALEVGLTAIQAVVGKVLDSLAALGGGLFDFITKAVEDPIGALQDLGNAIVENVENRIAAIQVLGDAVQKLLAGDFKSAAKTAADGVIQLGTGVKGATDAISDFGEEISEAVDAGANLARQNIALRASIRNLRVEEGKAQAQAENLRKARDDERKDLEERIRLNDEVLVAEERRTKAQEGQVQARIQLLRNEASLAGRLNEEQKDELAELEAELFFIRDDFATRTTELLTEGNALRAEQAVAAANAVVAAQQKELLASEEGTVAQLNARKELARANAELRKQELNAEALNAKDRATQLALVEAELNKELADIDKEAQERRLESELAFLEARTVALTAEQQKELSTQKATLEGLSAQQRTAEQQRLADQLAFEQAKRDQALNQEGITEGERQLIIAQAQAKELELFTAFEAEKLRVKKQADDAQSKLDQERAKAQQDSLNATASAFGTAASLFEENTKAYQAFASGEAVISTFLAANKALAEVPFPANIAVVAATIAKGLVNVAKINGVKFAEGGMLKGASHAQGGIPGYAPGFGAFEAEGGEYITNKAATANNFEALRTINTYGKSMTFDVVPRFADGGQLAVNSAISTAQEQLSIREAIRSLPNPVVSVQEINTVQGRVNTNVAESNV